MKSLYPHYTGHDWQINHIENGFPSKLPGKQNTFRNKTDCENCINSMVKNNPKHYKIAEL